MLYFNIKLCFIKLCVNDSFDELILRNQWVSEMCKRLRDNKVIDFDLYNEMGLRYFDIGMLLIWILLVYYYS